MPVKVKSTKTKLKTSRAAAKRFKKTGSGRYVHKSSHRRHLLTSKSTKRKRQLRGDPLIHPSDTNSIARMLTDK